VVRAFGGSKKQVDAANPPMQTPWPHVFESRYNDLSTWKVVRIGCRRRIALVDSADYFRTRTAGSVTASSPTTEYIKRSDHSGFPAP
jgi:hypothetical protein